MYSPVKLGFKFIQYLFTASNGKGHGVHSPFVFDFITKVLNDTRTFYAYSQIEQVRNTMFGDQTVLTIQDFGAGSGSTKSNLRKVNDIARSALKPAKYGQLLFRMVDYYQCGHIVELGTSLGITSAYLASGNHFAKVYTFEGADEIADKAATNFATLSLTNITVIRGDFDETLHGTLQQLPKVDLAFIDGNHRIIPTLQYFDQLLRKTHDHSILVFDDIHWSLEMEEAWAQICSHPAVTLSIDLFFIGIVFFRKEQKVAQHFTIRF